MPGQGVSGVAASSSDLLWEWNKTDVSQFDGTVAAAHLFVNTTLSVVADTTLPGQNKLRLTANPGSGGGGAVWLITAPLVFTGTLRRYMIEYETENIDVNSGGVAFLAEVAGEGPDLFSHAWCFGIAGETQRFDNGTWEQGGNTKTVHSLGAGSSRALVRVHIRGEKPAGSQPIWSAYANSRTRHNVHSAGMKYTRPGFTAWSSGWNNLTCDRVGLAINAGSGNAPVFDLFSLRIFKDGFADVSI